MRAIESIWIINKEGETLFNEDFHNQGSKDIDSILFGSIISAVQSFAREFGEDSAKSFGLGNSDIYMGIDKSTKIIFALKCEKKASSKKIRQMLKKIKETFIENFQKSIASGDMSLGLFSAFAKDLRDLLRLDSKSRVGEFFDSL